jgi:hypothetical protein
VACVCVHVLWCLLKFSAATTVHARVEFAARDVADAIFGCRDLAGGTANSAKNKPVDAKECGFRNCRQQAALRLNTVENNSSSHHE